VELTVIKQYRGKSNLPRYSLPYHYVKFSLWKPGGALEGHPRPENLHETMWQSLDDLQPSTLLVVAVNPFGGPDPLISVDHNMGPYALKLLSVTDEADPKIAEFIKNLPRY
jgi:hypothetical protein